MSLLRKVELFAGLQMGLLILLVHDLLGQEGMIRAIQEDWVPSHISGPFELVGLVFVTVRLYRCRKVAEKAGYTG